jgi:hypothetical protein
MAQGQSNGIIDQFKPTICWLSETINLGLEVFKGFMSGVSGQKEIQKLLIWQLGQLSKFMPLNLIET